MTTPNMQLDLFGGASPIIYAPRVCPCCHGTGQVDGPAPSAPARPTDPATSHEAGPRSTDVRRFSAQSRSARLLQYLANFPCTAQQAALDVIGDASVSAIEGCRRRVSDLVAAGYVADIGERAINPGSSDEAIVWYLTPAGHEALFRLDETGWSL